MRIFIGLIFPFFFFFFSCAYLKISPFCQTVKNCKRKNHERLKRYLSSSEFLFFFLLSFIIILNRLCKNVSDIVKEKLRVFFFLLIHKYISIIISRCLNFFFNFHSLECHSNEVSERPKYIIGEVIERRFFLNSLRCG